MSSTSSMVDTPETQLVAGEENRHRAMGHTAFRRLTMLLIGVAAAAGIAFASPGHADAAVANCTKVDCTVYLSKSETRALANGRIPAPPAFVQGPARAAYYALAVGHKAIAGQYANRGWCSAFRITLVPWKGQGYDGYKCNWN